tara:strand:+ start:691 stop:963 length:273 start_codon:yes stop_codon:yes gene_type:complete
VKIFSSFLIFLIHLYQRIGSPALRVFTGSAAGCRFSPSCSHYAIEAVETHGFIKGILFSLKRILRCHPGSKGGYDPVPRFKLKVARSEKV